MTNNVEFVTTDGAKYVLRNWMNKSTSSLPAGQAVRPTLTITQDSSLAGASVNAWEPTLYNQTKQIIPLYISMVASQQPNNPRMFFRFSTPYLIQQSAKFGRNTWAPLIAPYTQIISYDVSSYPPTADFTTVAFQGNIILKEYERIAFASSDFMEILSPVGSQKFITLFPTYNISSYSVQQQQTAPAPLTGTILNDFINTLNIGYQPAWGAPVDVTVETQFLYFELVSRN